MEEEKIVSEQENKENPVTENEAAEEQKKEEVFDYVDASTLVNNGKHVGRLYLRSKATTLCLAAIAVAIMAIFRNLTAFIIGGIMLVPILLTLFLVKDAIAADVYDDAVVLYQYEDQNKAVRLPVDKIFEWNNNLHGDNKLAFYLDNGQVFTVVCCEISKADRYLDEVMPGKAAWERQMNKIREAVGNGSNGLTNGIKRLFRRKK